jgi:proteic killer suppression protein
MDVRFEDDQLCRLEVDSSFTAGLPPNVVRAFRKAMQLIRAARDERDFYQMKSLRFEKLQGQRKGQSSMRLNDQLRLICWLEGDAPKKVLVIRGIEDYH